MHDTKIRIAAIGGMLSSLLGVLAIPMLLLICCNIIDYFTGVIAAPSRSQRVDSDKGLKGIRKKVCMWLLVIVGGLVDILLFFASEIIGIHLPFNFAVGCIVCIWIICNELLSILENISDTGVALPGFLLKIVKYIKQQAENKADFTETDNSED